MSKLFDELKRRRVIRTVIAYAATAFIALQVADLTFDAIGFPEWSYRFLVILSIVGFPVTAVSAWIFDLRSGRLERTPKVEGGGVRRAHPIVAVGVVVGTVALAAFGTWLVQGSGAVVGEMDSDLIMVAPFRVAASDASLIYLREGVVDLLAAKLTGSPRVVDPRTLMSAWRDRAGSAEADLSEREVVELAAVLGAGRVLFGSIVGGANDLTLTASLRDVASYKVVAETTLPGSADSLASMIDGLAARLLGAQAGAPMREVTSSSADAVRHWTQGRRLYRAGDFGSALASFDRALALDSTFAMAALGAIDSNGMQLLSGDVSPYRRMAWENRSRLSPDDQLYLRAVIGVNYPDYSSIAETLDFRRGVAETLNRAEAWYQYGDYLFHFGHLIGLPDELERAEQAFRTAVQLDPEFINAKLHLNWTLQLRGDPRWREVTVIEPPFDLAYLAETLSMTAVTTPGFQEELPERLSAALDSFGWNALSLIPFEAFAAVASISPGGVLNPVADRATIRAMELSANPAQLAAARDIRWNFLANLRRWDEALGSLDEVSGDGVEGRRLADQRILEAAVLWEAELSPDVVRAAAERLDARWREAIAGPGITATSEVEVACLLGLYLASTGSPGRARAISNAVRTGVRAEEALTDLLSSARRSCSLLLDARVGFPSSAGALERLSEWLDVGPPAPRMRLIANLETARMWKSVGDAERTWAHARRQERGVLSLNFLRPLRLMELRAFESRGGGAGSELLRNRLGVFEWNPPEDGPGGER